MNPSELILHGPIPIHTSLRPRTCRRTNPLGIDGTPRLSWVHRGQGRQAAYRILAASDHARLVPGRADLWDSGRIASTETHGVAWSGPALRSGQIVHWLVQTWDGQGTLHQGEPASFEMGVLVRDDWQAEFISPRWYGGGGRGYHSAVLPEAPAGTFWIQVDLKESAAFDAIELHPCWYREMGASGSGFGFPLRFRLEAAERADMAQPVLLYESAEPLPNPGLAAMVIRPDTPARGRHVRLTVLESFAAAPGFLLFCLDELRILRDGVNLALHQPVTVANRLRSTIVAGGYDWHPDCLTDGVIHVGEPRHDQGEGNLLRRIWRLDKPAVRARAYVGCRGWYELRIDGTKVGDAVLDTAWTDADRRVLYSTWDITRLLGSGERVVTVHLGSGWSDEPAVILRLVAEHADGTSTVLTSDTSWRVYRSPVVESHVYHGETHDARLERAELLDPHYDDDRPCARILTDYRPELSAQMLPPIRVTGTVQPVALSEPVPGVWVFDLGQNLAGWVRLRVQGERGREIRLRFAESIFDDGSVWTDAEQTAERRVGRLAAVDGMLNTANLRWARATDRYICAGTGLEMWEPRFTYHGFRFVELTGFPGRPGLDAIEAQVVHTDVPLIGSFSSSDPVLDWAQRASQWSLRSNLPSVPTDCCQRDERQGWMDAHHVAAAMLMNFDAATAYGKWLQDMRDAQRADGAMGDTTPFALGRRDGDIAWTSATVLLPWEVYEHTGDRGVLEDHWPSLRRYMEHLDRAHPTRVVDDSAYGGDWLAFEETPHQLTNTGFLLLCARTTACIARVLGLPDDEAVRWERLAAEVRMAFHQHFFDPRSGTYGGAVGPSRSTAAMDGNDSAKERAPEGGIQFANAFALHLDVVPRENRAGVFAHLVARIEARGRQLSSGIAGTKPLLEVLSAGGRTDLALALVTSHACPGFGYMMDHQATTFWEHWTLKTGQAMNSHNHAWMAVVSGWMLRWLAGIQTDAGRPGYERIIFAPQFPAGLDHVAGSIRLEPGTVASAWRRDGNVIRLELTIPENSTGLLRLPAGWGDAPHGELGAGHHELHLLHTQA